MMIDPLHSGPTCNGYNNGDHAGTPSPPLPTRLGWKVGYSYLFSTRLRKTLHAFRLLVRAPQRFGRAATVQLPSKMRRFLIEFRELSRVRSTESSGFMERAMGIEPTSEAWEASILPLNYARSVF